MSGEGGGSTERESQGEDHLRMSRKIKTVKKALRKRLKREQQGEGRNRVCN